MINKAESPAWNDFDLVFSSEIGTALMRRNIVRRHFKRILDNKEAKLPKIRLYDLRPYCASLLLAAGINVCLSQEVTETWAHYSIYIGLGNFQLENRRTNNEGYVEFPERKVWAPLIWRASAQ